MYKGLKKVIFVMLVLASVFTLIGSSAFAEEITVKIDKRIDKTNDYINAEIEKTQREAEKEVLKAERKNLSKEELDLIIDEIVDKLLEKTEQKTDILIDKAEKSDIVVEKNYIEVEIYDRVILIDPLYAH